MMEYKGIVAFLLSPVPVRVTGLQGIRLHLGDLHKVDTNWQIESIKEFVWVICNIGPRNSCLIVVGCMTCAL
jgi:hypothetical protein